MTDADRKEIGQWLMEQFGGVWISWGPENTQLPGMTVAAQLKGDNAGRSVLTGLLLLGDVITADSLRKVPVAEIEDSVNEFVGTVKKRIAELTDLPPLARTPEMTPEDFSRVVAQHYNVWARYTRHPAVGMAQWAGAKPPTVHTWIREARLRGFLPPAQRRKGKK